MLLLAALAASTKPVTTLDKLKAIPPDFWGKLGLAVLIVIALVIFLRKVAKMNKLVLAVVMLVLFVVSRSRDA